MPTTIGTGMAIEGDAVSVNGTIVKLWGIDAPDKGQTCLSVFRKEYDCFNKAKDALTNLVGSNVITCYVRGKDSQGQKVGTCGVNGLDLGALMIKSGWALSFLSLSPQYVRLESLAQAKKIGVWAGQIEAPWLYRSRLVADKNKKKK